MKKWETVFMNIRRKKRCMFASFIFAVTDIKVNPFSGGKKLKDGVQCRKLEFFFKIHSACFRQIYAFERLSITGTKISKLL